MPPKIRKMHKNSRKFLNNFLRVSPVIKKTPVIMTTISNVYLIIPLILSAMAKRGSKAKTIPKESINILFPLMCKICTKSLTAI